MVQFIDVITTYELLGVQFMGLVGDGGGSNVKFINTLFGIQSKCSNLPIPDSVFTCINLKEKRRLMY